MDYMWWIQMYLSGQIASLMLLLIIILYDHRKDTSMLFMLLLTIFWPLTYVFFILFAFTRFNRPPNGK